MASSSSSGPSASGDVPASCSERPSMKNLKKSPSLCDENHDLVTIITKSPAGIPDLKFVMHTTIACYHSPVLDRAFNGTFNEGQTQTVKIDVFAPYCTCAAVQSWTYTQRTASWKEEWGSRYHLRLFFTWILADRLIMPNLQFDVMALLIGCSIPLCLLDWIYENSSPDSKLRSFVVDSCGKNMYRTDKQTWLAAKTPVELLLDILLAQTRPSRSSKE
ncbi:hypothetical protein ONS96_000310 [Cadophora gregata f. sp. sojae]|nr:hypothetical protein ONS96_000310 [Cadophora gregata f. sp. sojae]